MIDNYDKERPILRIKMPLDLPAPEVRPVVDLGIRTSRRSGGSDSLVDLEPPSDPYVLMLSGSDDPLLIGQFRQFQAAAYNLNDPRLVWSVIAGAGTIKSNGRYYAPEELPENRSVTIKVTSRERPDLFVTATFLLEPPTPPPTPPPPTVYFNTQQSYTASCRSGMVGTPVTVTKSAGLFSSEVSQEVANALALAAATAEAQGQLSCTFEDSGLTLSATALDANGRIRLTVGVPYWYGDVDWKVTIGSPTGNLSGGTFIKNTELGTPYNADNIQLRSRHTYGEGETPWGPNEEWEESYHLVFYFDSIDEQWLIGNADGDTWLLPVTVVATLTNPDPNLVLSQTWHKYLLV